MRHAEPVTLPQTYYSRKSIAAYLGVTARSVDAWTAGGLLPSIVLGGRRLYRLSAIDRALEHNGEMKTRRGRRADRELEATGICVKNILLVHQAYWPLSERRIHYALLNDPPLRHASKPDSVYRNDGPSTASLSDLVTRARLEGSIPWEAIDDQTRPVITRNVFTEVGGFIRKELDGFLGGYWRDLLQSQSNHIELVAEKNTLMETGKPVTAKYCLPTTAGHGYASLPPGYQMAQRYSRSGKEKLVLLLIGDHDPDGEEIAHSFARSMHDDFGIRNIHPTRVALTAEQVTHYRLLPRMKAKKTSSNYKRFVKQHGQNVWEVEALSLDVLQQILIEAIDSVLDVDAFNAELKREREDATFLEGVRKVIQETWRIFLNWGSDNGRTTSADV